MYAATSEIFVAQMLNLDLLGAIAFDKGCYTGQEVIARAHYRGKVKRRMQRWLNTSGIALKPGGYGPWSWRTVAGRGARGRRLSKARRPGGSRPGGRKPGGRTDEILAVGNFTPAAGPAAAPETAGTAAAGSAIAESAAAQVSGPLPLPYTLPD